MVVGVVKVEDTITEEIITKLPVTDEKDEEENNLCISSIGFLKKKKLIVLDLNGLLADIVSSHPKEVTPDATIARNSLFKRPFSLFKRSFSHEFLNFCFERFEVAVWSSRSKETVDSIIDYLMGDMKQMLIFTWDISHCTETAFQTVENKRKPLVCKDLRKIWDKYDPNLPWEKGYYNESNTLLLDDSPHKALLNPPYNSIFPHTFSYENQNDNSLAAGGDLRQYLEGLASAENMVKYVEQHPFGQERITETNEFWDFYLNVINSISACQPEK
ncbi:uncharacterized FCP1 homology domain-containing protein C1271.03c isoform X1 [Medicago truncatula]|uniref:Mitochondrial import inner membrane translocase subunit TIM50 n=1 Tax=Medicago truncatula TaxID=3880 RepID=I3RZN1_MEDTR|nr:uncharacterized FCP1 homology domain-containing protein C1271.03c isoform X1 [Medicago truncatula]XP_039683172.1 uncharacterized FCP1 homology domain-containing protein C1271.03c isoform X1 [Medicago truncatula]AFK33473.1 unknown [Medicago truncatula]KEH21691.1 NLI interacting factor-like phosphatase [Medicago truncatula]